MSQCFSFHIFSGRRCASFSFINPTINTITRSAPVLWYGDQYSPTFNQCCPYFNQYSNQPASSIHLQKKSWPTAHRIPKKASCSGREVTQRGWALFLGLDPINEASATKTMSSSQAAIYATNVWGRICWSVIIFIIIYLIKYLFTCLFVCLLFIGAHAHSQNPTHTA